MHNEYNLALRVLHWLRRFRKRCGYNVHSPLAFDFITGVVYCTEAYYAYDRLRAPLAASIARLDEYDPVSGLTARDLRLLFRLANYEMPAHIVCHGASLAVQDYLQAARPSATLTADALTGDTEHTGALTGGAAHEGEGSILLYYNKCVEDIASLAWNGRAGGMVIVRGIHRNATAERCWQTLCDHPDLTLTFDLGRFGIALRRPVLNRQHYIVNFF